MLKIKNLVFISILSVTQTTLASPPPTSSNVGIKTGAIEGILHASFIVQLVILILLSLSVLSWAIGWAKYKQFTSLKKLNTEFDNLFWSTSSLDTLFEKVDNFNGSSHARVFKAAYVEMKKIADSPMIKNNSSSAEMQPLSGVDNLERSLRKASENEIAEMENRLTILASTGSTGPFIGLFGTVWGIMNSFQQIGITGSASLAAVAPGISEALVTTAIGLAAAIPAVIIYNNCVSAIRKEEVSLNNFSTDFLNIVKRNFFKG
jgi:biopolymer transport protein TolQ